MDSNKNNPVISIITPYFNGQDYIEETAKSVLRQTFSNFEWIIVDDGSSKEGKEKLQQIEKMDSRIKVFTNSYSSRGPAQTRDFGIRNSAKSSKYIVFLDADDLYNKTFLECSYWTLETHPEASWTYTDSVNFGAKNFLWRKWYDVEWELRENILLVSACVRKADLIEVGGFELKEKKVYEDWYLWIKLIKAGKFPVRMNSLLTYYRQKKGTSELKSSNEENKKNALRIIEEAKRDIVDYKDAIQFPKYDYNWEEIKDEIIKIKDTQKSNKINILMIIPWMVTGGADRFNLDLIKRMDRKKFSFTIISTMPSKNEWRRQFEKYATIYDLTTFLEMKDWIGFINYIIKKNNIKLIFNSNSEFGYRILPYLKAKYPQIPITDFVHMEEWYMKNGGFSRDSSIMQNVIDKTFTCNENSRNIFINYFKRNESEIKTIYIGVDEKKFDPQKYNKEEIIDKINDKRLSKDKIIISYICRIAEQKRPYLMLEVVKKLAEIRENFVVVVAGEGSLLNGLKKNVKKEKLDDFFVFVGNKKNTEEIYAISDLTLNTSIKEGLAITSYESLAMGVPVVSSDVGGQKELINKEVGVTVPCIQQEREILNYNYTEEEVLNYIVAIQEVINNLKYYKSNCRKRISNRFTIDNMIKNMEKEFIDIVQNPNKQKIENGEKLSGNIDVLKELISSFLVSNKLEYEWICEEFNHKNIHISNFKNKILKKKQYYEHTLEYKIKHPIVLALRKVGIYESTKRILGMQ